MTTTGTKQDRLVDGPGIWDLMLGTFDNSNEKPRKVYFKGENENYQISITGVKKESGSGQDWLFEGIEFRSQKVRGYFNTRDRKGWIELI